MKLPFILQQLHEKVTYKMSKSWFVENVLIAKVTDEVHGEYDCIYCTIIRTTLLSVSIGGMLGFVIGWLL